MNKRQTLRRLMALGLAANALPARAQAPAQPSAKLWRVGFMWPGTRADEQPYIDTIIGKLRERGYVEGRHFSAEYRFADQNEALFPTFAAEYARLKMDLIVTRSTGAAIATKAATRDIPVVFGMVSDPVASGIITTLARPGGNLTGWSNMLTDTHGKLIEFLRAVRPKLAHVALLSDARNPGKVLEVALLRQTAAKLGLRLSAKNLNGAADVEPALAQIARERPDGLIVLVDSLTRGHTRQIVDFAAKQRLPAIYQVREFVDAGGLMSYGLNIRRQFERTAEYMHRIFQGKQPSDLPVEQPTRIELVINGKTAKALGIAIPQELLLRAEEVIE